MNRCRVSERFNNMCGWICFSMCVCVCIFFWASFPSTLPTSYELLTLECTYTSITPAFTHSLTLSFLPLSRSYSIRTYVVICSRKFPSICHNFNCLCNRVRILNSIYFWYFAFFAFPLFCTHCFVYLVRWKFVFVYELSMSLCHIVHIYIMFSLLSCLNV